MLKCLFILLFLSLQTHGAQQDPEEKSPYDFKEKAMNAIPNKTTPDEYYAFEELKDVFHSILTLQNRAKFDEFFGVMFGEKFPKPHHPSDFISSGYRCFWSKVMAANTRKSAEQQQEDQLMGLYEAVYFHKALIAQSNPELAAQIPTLAICRDCVVEAEAYRSHKTQ
jgi:hypothetical protein